MLHKNISPWHHALHPRQVFDFCQDKDASLVGQVLGSPVLQWTGQNPSKHSEKTEWNKLVSVRDVMRDLLPLWHTTFRTITNTICTGVWMGGGSSVQSFPEF